MVGLPCLDVADPTISQAELVVVNSLCESGATAISWQPLVGAAIFASLMILVFLYLFAVLFRNEKIIAWIKMEMYELISTVIIVIALIALIQGLCTFTAGWIFSDFQLAQMDIEGLESDSSMYVMSATYLGSVTDRITNWMCYDLAASVFADIGTATQFMIRPMGQGFHTTPLAGFFNPLKLILNNAMIAMIITYVINEGFLNILKYSIVAFPKFILPFGIVFRSFEPTRRFGGTLIALSIAFLVLYPILLSVSFYVSEIGVFSWGDLTDANAVKLTSLSRSLSETVSDIFNEIIRTAQEDDLSVFWDLLLGSLITLIQFLLSLVLTIVGGVFGLVYFFFGGVVVWWVAFVGFVLPAFNTVMLVYGMRSLGRTLGEPVDITSLTRVI